MSNILTDEELRLLKEKIREIVKAETVKKAEAADEQIQKWAEKERKKTI